MSAKRKQQAIERLKAVAIMRDGRLMQMTNKGSHHELRGFKDRLSGDVEGFVTTAGRFVDRREARDVAIACGQLDSMWKQATRAVLSSDIHWEATNP